MYGNTPGERSAEGQITSFTTKYRRDIYLWLYLTPRPPSSVRVPESGKLLFVDMWILGFGIWNTGHCDGNGLAGQFWRMESARSSPPLSKNLESSTWNPESTAWNPESKIILNSIHTWCLGTVPKYGTRWVIVWTHPFFKVVPQEFGYGAWARVEPTPFL